MKYLKSYENLKKYNIGDIVFWLTNKLSPWYDPYYNQIERDAHDSIVSHDAEYGDECEVIDVIKDKVKLKNLKTNKIMSLFSDSSGRFLKSRENGHWFDEKYINLKSNIQFTPNKYDKYVLIKVPNIGGGAPDRILILKLVEKIIDIYKVNILFYYSYQNNTIEHSNNSVGSKILEKTLKNHLLYQSNDLEKCKSEMLLAIDEIRLHRNIDKYNI